MKKIVLSLIISTLALMPVYAKADTTSIDYLKSKKHIAIMNPFAESLAQQIIKKSLKKEIGKGRYKVKFEGYTLGSMKRGIFKTLEIHGKNVEIEDIKINYLNLKTLTDYNWIDFNESPVKIKSDMTFAYELELTEESLNKALEKKDYQKILEKVNTRAYPLFAMHNVKIKIKHNRVYIIMDYSLPLASSKKRTFMISTDFKIENGKIKANNVLIDRAYGNLPLDKVTNLINLLDPLSFTLDILKEDHCKGQVESVKIEDNKIQIDGKMFIVKGE